MPQIFVVNRKLGPYARVEEEGVRVETKWCCGVAEMYGLDRYGKTNPADIAEVYRGIIAKAFQQYGFGVLQAIVGERTPKESVQALEILGFQPIWKFENKRRPDSFGDKLEMWILGMDPGVWLKVKPALPAALSRGIKFKEVDPEREHYVSDPS